MEKIDLYDKHRLPLGKIGIRGEKLAKDEHRTVVHICIFNSKGEMLLQQRASSKRLWPNMWDLSVGGGVALGENSEQAATRELKEEIGIDYDFTTTRPHLTINFENGYDDYYFLNSDLDLSKLTLEKDEVQKVIWASKEDVKKLFENKQFLPYIESFVLSLFDLKTQRGVIID